MWTAIVIICLVVAIMVGPIMMMQPTKRQRQLATLRKSALAHGLKVRMMTMPPGSVQEGESVAVYYHSWPDNKTLKNTWFLARQSFSHGAHFDDTWDWIDDKPAAAPWQAAIRAALPALPESVIAVEASSHSLGVSWLEKPEGQTPEQATGALSDWIKALMAQAPARSNSR